MPSAMPWGKLCEYMGLSEYEAKVYVSLIEAGVSKARKLSAMCGVPRTKIYSVLKKLVDMGLILEVPEDPKKFSPVPPKKAFESYLRSYQIKVKNLLLIVSTLEESFKKTKTEETPQKGTIWIINGRQEMFRKIGEMLSKAKNSVEIITNENGLILLYKEYNRLFDELTERSVEVHIGAPIGSNSQHALNELKYMCKVEEVPFQLPFIFLRTDRNQFLIANLKPDNFSTYSERDRSIFSDDSTLSEIICSLVHREIKISPFQHPNGDGEKAAYT